MFRPFRDSLAATDEAASVSDKYQSQDQESVASGADLPNHTSSPDCCSDLERAKNKATSQVNLVVILEKCGEDPGLAAERSEGARVRLRRPLVRERNSPVNDKGRFPHYCSSCAALPFYHNHHRHTQHGEYIVIPSRGPARSWLVSTFIFRCIFKFAAERTLLPPSAFLIITLPSTGRISRRQYLSMTTDLTPEHCILFLTRRSVLTEIFGVVGLGLVPCSPSPAIRQKSSMRISNHIFCHCPRLAASIGSSCESPCRPDSNFSFSHIFARWD